MILYFFPYELDEEYDRPSLKRPLEMLKAFKGRKGNSNVVEITGKYRNTTIHQLQNEIKNDKSNNIEFVYIESINKPLFLQCIIEKKINIFADYYFFWQCKKKNIPIAIFYRDALWVMERYRALVPKYSYYILKLAFYIEFKVFEFLVDVFFLPSLEMQSVLPFGDNRVHIDELPPAVDIEKYHYEKVIKHNKSQGIVLLYVGNINPDFYNISPLIDAVKKNSEVTLNLCCRKNDWDQFNHYYNLKQLKNIQVHHLEGEELEKLYKISDVHMMLYAEDSYRLFAVPFKLYESLQYGVPIITTEGTKAASLVRELDIGWTVSKLSEVTKLFTHINSDRSFLIEKEKNIHQIINNNTWYSRTEKVIKVCQKIKF